MMEYRFKCNICNNISISNKCPKCKNYDFRIIKNYNPIMIFLKKTELQKVFEYKLTGFLFNGNNKNLKHANKKFYVTFFNKNNDVTKEIKYLQPIIIKKTYIEINGYVETDNIELAKIAFSLGIDIKDRKEKQKIIDYVKEKFGLPFKGYYLKV